MMFLIIYFLSKIILKIEFFNNEYYSIEVYDYVNSKVKYVNKIGLLKEDISIINKDLRNKFYQYQWIDIEKKGTSIFINISKTTDDKIEVESDKVGSLYSRYDAYILGYYCKSGNILIQNNSFVQKDEELISGVIPKYNTNGEFVRASGYVIGEVTTFENIKIKKKIDERIRSGNITRYKQISFLKQKSNSPYEEYEMEKRVLFKIGNLILLEEITYYELISNTITYNENDALIYGKSMIYNNFISNKKYDFEKIFSIKELNIKEDNSYFYLSYKVNKKIDICYFSDIKINEINDIE